MERFRGGHRKSPIEHRARIEAIRQHERLAADNLNRLMANLQQRPMLPIESEEAKAQRYREIELRRERPRLPPNLPEEPDDYDYAHVPAGVQPEQGNDYWTLGMVSDQNYWGYMNHQREKEYAKEMEKRRLEQERKEKEYQKQREEWKKQREEWKREREIWRLQQEEYDRKAQQREKDAELQAMERERIAEQLADLEPRARQPVESLASLRRGKRPTVPPPSTRPRVEAAPPPRREGPLSAEEHTAYNLKPTGGPADPGHRQKRDTYWSAQVIAGNQFHERNTPR